MSFDPSLVLEYAPMLLAGGLVTARICLVAFLLIPFLGTPVALAVMGRNKLLRRLAIGYVEAIRNTPFLIQAFLAFYGLPLYGIRLGAELTGILCLTIYGSAYFAEALRAAVLSIPRGQFEAADALGLKGLPKAWNVVVPQLWPFLLPQVSNTSIFLIKESAILSVITVPEITFAAQMAISRTFSPAEFYLAIALFYWGVSSAVASVISLMERRLEHVRSA
ncbi:MAG: amino acid ABC transporter permease [Parvibaculaceae bacterium]